MVRVSEETDVRLNLRATSPAASGKDVPSTCIAVYAVLDGNLRFSMIYEDDSYAARPWGYFSR